MAGPRLFRAGRPFAELDACRGGDRRFVVRLRVDQPASASLIGVIDRRSAEGRGRQDEARTKRHRDQNDIERGKKERPQSRGGRGDAPGATRMNLSDSVLHVRLYTFRGLNPGLSLQDFPVARRH